VLPALAHGDGLCCAATCGSHYHLRLDFPQPRFTVVLFVIAFAVNRAYPTPATPWILTLLGLLAFGALGAGLYFRVKNLNWDK
jgi:hypothetical protein